MQKYINSVQTLTGDAVQGATIVVTNSVGAPVTVYSDNSGTVKPTVTTDVKGMFEFYAADGRYNLSVSGPGIYPYTISDIQIDDTLLGSTLIPAPATNVAGIRALDKTIYGNVSTYGYTAKGDGGAGDYYYDAADTTSTDDGGSVIVATDGGRWKLIHNNVFNILQFGATGDGTTDDTTPRNKAVDAIIANNGGTLLFPGKRTYRITNQKTITVGNFRLQGEQGSKILADFADSSTNAMFRFAPASTTSTDSTITANIAKGDASITVPDGTIFQIGKFISIINDEYSNGVTGISGFQPETKGELNRVLFVDTNTVYLASRARDSYDNASFPVTVRIHPEINNITVDGLQFYGTGNGITHTSANPTGVRALSFQQTNNITVTNNRFENFPRFATAVNLCEDIRFEANEYIGRDLSQTNNAAITPSVWFTGSTFTSVQNVAFVGNTASYMRRHIDFDAGSCIPRNISIVGNTAISCGFVVGTHGCQDVTITGNTGRGCGAGIVFRGYNAVISGNDIGDVDSYHIKLGGLSTITQTYAELPTVGSVTITGNRGQGGTSALILNVDCTYLNYSNNIGLGLTDHGILLAGRRMANVSVHDNIIDAVSGMTTTAGVNVLNVTAGGIVSARNISIKNNKIHDFYRGIIADGAGTRDAPMYGLIIEGNDLKGTADTDIRLGNSFSSVSGYFAPPVTVKDNVLYGGGFNFIPSRMGRLPVTTNIGKTAIVQQEPVYQSAAAVDPGNYTSISIGNYIQNTTPTASGFMGRVCITSGTFGTLAVTGGITAGTTSLVVSSISTIQVGAYITIAGAGVAAAALPVEVLAISGTTVTVSVAASTTVAGAAVTYTAPVLKTFGPISA